MPFGTPVAVLLVQFLQEIVLHLAKKREREAAGARVHAQCQVTETFIYHVAERKAAHAGVGENAATQASPTASSRTRTCDAGYQWSAWVGNAHQGT